jgi:nitrate reductase NapD
LEILIKKEEMNISGILVQTRPENLEVVIKQIKESDCCEYHQHDEKGRIIVTIEGANVEEELQKLNELKAFDKVVAADMMYAYSEDELEEAREKLDANQELPGWLNDPNARAEDIQYHGDLKGKY